MQEALLDFVLGSRIPRAGVAQPGTPPQRQLSIEQIFRALDLVPSPILIGMNPEATDIRSNAAGHALFGGGDRNLSQSAAEDDRPDFTVYSDGKLVRPDDLPMQRAARTGQPVQASECELRFENGVVKFIKGKAAPVFGQNGTVRGSIGVFLDVTEIRDAEKRHALMMDEVQHRAKNTLALVQAVAAMSLKSELPPEKYEAFLARLQVIGRSVDVFQQSEAAKKLVGDIIEMSIRQQIGENVARVLIDGDAILIADKAAAPLAMAIHELTTNACKYGSLSVAGGIVQISWAKLEEADVLSVEWTESGGPKVSPPAKTGFGSRLLAQILGAPSGKRTEITFKEQGVQCRLYAALS